MECPDDGVTFSLAESEVFSGLDEGAITMLTSLAHPCSLAAGKQLFAMGEPASRLFVIRSGQVDLVFPFSILGVERSISVETLTRGDCLAWSALVSPQRLTMSALASTDCDLLSFRRSDLLEIFESHPEIGCRVLLGFAAMIGHRLVLTQAMLVRQIQAALNQGFGLSGE